MALPDVGTWEEEQDWGMLRVRRQGELTLARGQLGRCVPEAGHLEGRDRMCKKQVGRGLRLSGRRVPS